MDSGYPYPYPLPSHAFHPLRPVPVSVPQSLRRVSANRSEVCVSPPPVRQGASSVPSSLPAEFPPVSPVGVCSRHSGPSVRNPELYRLSGVRSPPPPQEWLLRLPSGVPSPPPPQECRLRLPLRSAFSASPSGVRSPPPPQEWLLRLPLSSAFSASPHECLLRFPLRRASSEERTGGRQQKPAAYIYAPSLGFLCLLLILCSNEWMFIGYSSSSKGQSD